MSTQFIELKIAQLKRANVQLKQILAFLSNPSEDIVNEILDKILENEALIQKLKEGLS